MDHELSANKASEECTDPAPLKVSLPAHDLRRVHRLHLVHPASSRHDLADRANLVRGVTGDANVVVALENELNIANVKLRRLAELAKLACAADDVVYEVVGKLKDRLASG